MLDAAREARSFAQGRSRDDLDVDRQLLLALVKCLEIVGEAAARTTEPAQQTIPGVPWQDVIGMRNRLIHGYFDVDHDIVWQTVRTDLPPLCRLLEAALALPDTDA